MPTTYGAVIDQLARERATRRAWLLATARDLGCAGVVVAGNARYLGNASPGSGDLSYFAGWSPRFGRAFLVGDGQKWTLLTVSRHEALSAARWFEKVDHAADIAIRAVASEDIGRFVLAHCRRGDQAVASIGGVGDLATLKGMVAVTAQSQVTVTDLTAPVGMRRLIKTSVELAAMEQAAGISDRLIAAWLAGLRQRRSLLDILGDVERSGRVAGAGLATCWLSESRDPGFLRYKPEELADTEVINGHVYGMGTFVNWLGYWGHAIRMAALTPIDNEVQLAWEGALAQHRQAVAACQAGLPATGVQQAALSWIDRNVSHGFYSHPSGFRQAHFIGADYADPFSEHAFPQPDTWRDQDEWDQGPPSSNRRTHDAHPLELASGMCLEIHTNVGYQQLLMAIGNQYVVEAGQARKLGATPDELFEISP